MNQSTSTYPTPPEISIVMPCYNEEEAIGFTIPKLVAAFEKAGYRIELIAVDNGSTDRTGEIIESMARENPAIVPARVVQNEGYGNGILQGIKVARASWVGMIPADGQVDPEDVVLLYEAVSVTNGRVVGKVRRRFRMDGLIRKVVSSGYNAFVWMLYPRLGTIDVNGSPKILPRDALHAMQLTSKEWFLDPEIMIKAHYMNLRVLEFNVFARMRGTGLSHVRPSACWEFFVKLLAYRFSNEITEWQKQLELPSIEVETTTTNSYS